MRDIVTLIDGSNLCHRLYHTVGADRLERSLQVQLRAINLYTASKRTVVAFDAPGDNWRRREYPQYKMQRSAKPADLQPTLDAIVDRLTASDECEVSYLPGVEADDIIASNCDHAVEMKHRVVIVSTDKDLYQMLVDGHVTQLTRFKTERGVLSDPEWMTYQKFIDEFGFFPTQWPTYRALCGDTSDNVAGVKGIGTKAAQELMQNYPSIEAVMANRWQLPINGRQITALANSIASGEFGTMQRICTLRRDVFQEVA